MSAVLLSRRLVLCPHAGPRNLRSWLSPAAPLSSAATAEAQAAPASPPSSSSSAETSTAKPKSARAPSVLTTLPPGYHPGLALHALQHHSAGGKPIRLTDLRDLARAARPKNSRDGGVIKTALAEFKLNNGLVLDGNVGRVCMEGILRSGLVRPSPAESAGGAAAAEGAESDAATEVGSILTTAALLSSTPAPRRVASALSVLDAFADERTGLRMAVKAEYVDKNLEVLLDSVREMGLRLAEESGSDGGDDGEDGDEEAASDATAEVGGANVAALANRVLETTRSTMAALVKRGTNPESKMTKRARRRYLQSLRVPADQPDQLGPTPKTVDLGVKIVLELTEGAKGREGTAGTGKVVREAVLTPYRAGGFQVNEETMLLVGGREREEKLERRKLEREAAAAIAAAEAEAEAEAEAAEAAEKAAAEAAAAAAEAEGEAADMEGDGAGAAGEEEGAEDDEAEGSSNSDDASGEKEKDSP